MVDLDACIRLNLMRFAQPAERIVNAPWLRFSFVNAVCTDVGVRLPESVVIERLQALAVYADPKIPSGAIPRPSGR